MLDFSVLKDLVILISKNKVKEITTIKDIETEQKKVIQLYNGLLSGKYKTDSEAAMDIYGKTEQYPSYKRLRRRLLDLLINTSFFIDTSQPKFTEHNKSIYNCYRLFSATVVLIRHDLKQVGIYLMKPLLEQTIKAEMTSLTTEILSILKTLYIATQMDSNEIKKLNKQIDLFEEKRYQEIKARRIFENLLEGFVPGRVTKLVIGKETEEDFHNFVAIADKINTTNFYFLTYSIGNIYYLSQNNIQKSLENSHLAVNLFLKRKTSFKGHIVSFAINELACYTHLKIFDKPEVNAIIDLCLQYTTPGTLNRFKVYEILIHHYIYAERWEDALDLYQSNVNHPRFQFLSNTNKEIWKIYAGYFHLLARLKVIDDALVEEKVGTIDIDQFEYDFKVLNTVKFGMNIPVLMLPVFFKALEGELDEHGRSIESLRKYVDRHLRKRKNTRSVAMIRLLVALDKYPIQPLAAKNAIKKQLKIFKEMPIELSEQSSAIEIVPYEKLWSHLLRFRRIYNL